MKLVEDQTGAVLVIAIIMLLILSIIGIYAMGSSIIEVKIAGQKRFYDAAFNDADGGVKYIQALSPFGGITSSNGPSNPVIYNSPNTNFHFTVNVSYLGVSNPREGIGVGYRSGFKQHYHRIQSTGRDTPIPNNITSVTLEVEGYRIGF
jgi:uncharacterized protein (UPF0333 family)